MRRLKSILAVILAGLLPVAAIGAEAPQNYQLTPIDILVSSPNGGVPAYPLLAPNGSASAPSFSFTLSPSTGMYSPGANQLAFSTNGSLALSFDASQNVTLNKVGALLQVGTGTSSACGILQFGTGGSGNAVQLYKSGAGNSVKFIGDLGDSVDLSLGSIHGTQNFGVWVNYGMVWGGVQTKTVTYTVAAGDSGSRFDNQGDATAAPGTVFPLPPALAGRSYTFFNATAGGLRIKASGTDVIRFPGSDSTAGGTQTTTTIGGSVTITCVTAGRWNAEGQPGGTWVAN